MLDQDKCSTTAGSQSLSPGPAKPIGELADEFVRIALGAADHYGRKITRSLGLPADDIHDVRQDLLVEVFRRAGFYDPGRAALSTFIELVTRHAADMVASRRVTDRQVVRRSIDDPIVCGDGSRAPLGNLLPEERGLGAFWAGCPDPFMAVEERIDLERFVQRLPDDLRRLCRLLQTETPTVAQRHSGLSPALFYRQLQELRMRLRAIGLGPETP
jgi:DNA-directed RNA polymerase specialized sigma24 family protein